MKKDKLIFDTLHILGPMEIEDLIKKCMLQSKLTEEVILKAIRKCRYIKKATGFEDGYKIKTNRFGEIKSRP